MQIVAFAIGVVGLFVIAYGAKLGFYYDAANRIGCKSPESDDSPPVTARQAYVLVRTFLIGSTFLGSALLLSGLA